jgi:hypothetical protein
VNRFAASAVLFEKRFHTMQGKPYNRAVFKIKKEIPVQNHPSEERLWKQEFLLSSGRVQAESRRSVRPCFQQASG